MAERRYGDDALGEIMREREALRAECDELHFDARVALPEAQERFKRAEAEVERLQALVEPKDWQGWEQIDTIYEEARLLRKERNEARDEVERLREALRVFGSHSDRCARATGQYLDPPDYTCTCGLEAILNG